MKYIILLADGMADRPVDALGGKTPLQAAKKPNMDALFARSECGMVNTLVPGLPLGSDVGNLSVLGHDPRKFFTGRAPMEAANMGIETADDDIAFRCNVVTVREGIMDDYSSGHITTEESTQLMAFIQEKLGGNGVRFYPGKSYRHIMITKKGASVSWTAPHDITGKPIDNYMPQGEGADELIALMKKSSEILIEHPVNQKRVKEGKKPATMIWLWGQGRKIKLPKLSDTFGLTGGVISAVDLVNGIGISMGLEVIKVPGMTGYIDTNFRGKAEYALNELEKKDFIYLHVEATDEMGHNGDASGKVLAIEKFDSEVVGPVMKGMEKFGEYKIMITSDHATPICARTHTDEPVPYVIFSSMSALPFPVKEYSEEAVRKGNGKFFDRGFELFPYFIKEA